MNLKTNPLSPTLYHPFTNFFRNFCKRFVLELYSMLLSVFFKMNGKWR